MLRSIFRLPSINSTVFRFAGVRSASSDSHAFEKLTLKKKDGEVGSADLQNKAVLVFFSAGWCPSCKEFTPYLKEFYENTKNEGLQVVWVSRDRSEEDQIDYYEKNLPDWPYLPYGSKELRLVYEIAYDQPIYLEIFSTFTRFKLFRQAVKLVKSDGEVADDGARVKIEKNYKDSEAAKKIVAEWRKKVGLDGN
ncbi:putative nucleoredoxin 1 [Aphelenchoides besseyi]|nr:putative nucleoredoxin 1 [Aphelenchoides besseyi]